MRRSRLLRASLAFAALPGVVAIAVPLLMAWAIGVQATAWLGLLPLAAGLAALLWCVREFYVTGQGTLAPWEPPRHLVARGPYRWSRNPMYLAVALMLAGWAIVFESRLHVWYAVAFLVAAHLRVVRGEEPRLDRSFRDPWRRYASSVPRWIFPTRTSLLVAVGAVLVLLPVAGLLYEVYVEAKVAREYPAPGTMVDIGGRRIHMLCVGAGEPVVMFEAAGMGVSSTSAAAVRERIARRTRVCSYDRLGMGWSDAGASVVTVGELARQLGVLQDRAEMRAPAVLVGSSIGGLTIEMFARRYPERVAGLVFIDAASSGKASAARGWLWLGRLAPALGVAARFGLVRLWDPLQIPTDTEQGQRSAAMSYATEPITTGAAIVAGLGESVREFDAAPPLRNDVPLVVLSAADESQFRPRIFKRLADLAGLTATRVDVHRRLAAQSTKGRWQMVPKSGHLIYERQPEAVAMVIEAMLDDLAKPPPVVVPPPPVSTRYRPPSTRR